MIDILCLDIPTLYRKQSFRYKKQMTKKKIAIVHDKLNVGGTEKALLSMLKIFDYGKYDVTLWLMNGEGELQSELDERVKVCYFTNDGYTGAGLVADYLKERQIIKLMKCVYYRRKSKQLMDHHLENLKYSIYSLPLITEEEYDCVIVYQGLYLHLLATALSRFKAKRRVAWIHMRFNHSSEQIEAFDPLYSGFDKIFCVSEKLKDHFIDIYHLSDRTEVFYNIFDVDEIKNKAKETMDIDYSGKNILVTVGRISKEKGQLMIPEIAKRLKEKGYDCIWLIIGDGPQKEELSKVINQNKLDDTILLLGNKRNPYPYIQNCTIYVQPSYSEGFCTTTMEAKILGKPIVATDVAGMNEQFKDGYDGIIVNDIDPNGIFKELWKVCRSKELQEKLHENTSKTLFDTNDEMLKFDHFMGEVDDRH